MTVIDRLVTILGFQTDLSKLRRFDSAIANTRKRLDNISAGAFNVGRQLTIAGGVAVGVFGLAAKAAISWESDFTGVRKTVDATEEEFAALAKTLRTMAKEKIPLPVGELARIAELGGQLGIETPALAKFTEVMANLGATTDLAAEDAAIALAQFFNVMGTGEADMERMASSIVDLGNSFATNEPTITTFASRLAADSKILGITEAQTLAYATTLGSLGINAEAGGTAMSRVFNTLGQALQTGNSDLAIFAKTAGITTHEMQALAKEDGANAALLKFFDGLARGVKNGQNLNPILEGLGFENIRVRRAVLSVANAGDLLNRTLATSESAWKENTALAKEANLRYGTTASKLAFAKNNMNDLAITAGDVLVPAITDVVKAISPLITKFTEFAEKHPRLIQLACVGLSVALLGAG